MFKRCKRLIEVDLPIRRISVHASREKSIRHGHISTIHIWWARRPLGACRAVVCSSLLPDPCDPLCPSDFVKHAGDLMLQWGIKNLGKCSPESYKRFNKIVKNPEFCTDVLQLRGALIDFIADFSNWDNATDICFIKTARALIEAAHKDEGRPLVVDPFAGGGAIPLETLRCGADAFASDLNPLPVLLNRFLLEWIPRYGEELVKEFSLWSKKIEERLVPRITSYYAQEQSPGDAVAYLWARTIICEGPGCGVSVPLIRSLCLAQRGSASINLTLSSSSNGKSVDVEIAKARAATGGTVQRGAVTCPCCGYTTPVTSVRRQLAEKSGGSDDSQLVAVVCRTNSEKIYRLPTKEDFDAVNEAIKAVDRKAMLPQVELPLMSGVFNVPLYGINRWDLLFSARQLLIANMIGEEVHHCVEEFSKQHNSDFALALKVALLFARDKYLDFRTTLCGWISKGEKIGHTYGRQALGMIFDWCEGTPIGNMSGSWSRCCDYLAKVIQHTATSHLDGGHAQIADAQRHPLPDDSVDAVITDPPYYNAVPYADLSDFFHVWLHRDLKNDLPELFGESSSPKKDELCEMSGWDSRRYPEKDGKFYEQGMERALAEARRICCPGGIGTIVFAHKTTEGWETLLSALIRAGWIVTASWPIDTERSGRLRAMNSAALGSSVHLVCRPREDEDGKVIERIGDWRDVLSELPGRIAAWLPRLASEGVVGADAIFACLGPALEIFSRYSSVEKASGEIVQLREYLEHVWAEVARQALNMIFEGADASGFEEDARLTAMWLWTLRTEANGNGEDDEKVTSLPGYTLEYDAARKIAQGLGCHMENLGHLVEIKGDKAMLLSAESRARYLFGKEDTHVTAKRSKKVGLVQQDLFSLLGVSDEEEAKAEQIELERPPAGKTTLDQLHQAMLLFTAGRGAALKRFLVDDGIGNNPQFWTLAQALSALYPSHTNEKRWVDGVLARKKGLGF